MNKLLVRKNNLKDSIPLLSLMIAINLILVSLVTYIPFTNLFIYFVLPIPSLFIALLVKYRYYIIYFIITLSLGLLVSLGDISFCLLNLLPSLITAFLISFLAYKKVNFYLSFFINSLLTFLLNLLSILFIKAIFNVDIISLIINILNIKQTNNLDAFILSFIYVFSTIESFVSYLILKYEIKSIIDLKTSNKINEYEILSFYLFIFISATCINFYIEIYLLFFFISIVLTIIIIFISIKNPQNLIIFLIFLIISWLFYVLLYNEFTLIKSIVILLFFPFLSLSYAYLKLIFNDEEELSIFNLTR